MLRFNKLRFDMLYTHRNDIACEQAVHLDLAPVVQKVDSAIH